ATSTGQPRAHHLVLTTLPVNFPVPILIVQNMPPNFTKSLADHLNTLCQIKVKEAVHGEVIKKGTAYIAPGDYHMKARKAGMSLAIELTDRKSTRLNSSHVSISYAVFCLKKKKKKEK